MDELEQLHAQIAELQNKAKELAEKKREPVIEDMKSKIKLYGITAKELGFATTEKPTEKPTEKHIDGKRSQPVAIKYRLGEKTWTGRGRQPLWIVEHLATGAMIEDLAV